MPTYEYLCMNHLCKTTVTETRKIDDRNDPIDCLVCGTRMKLLISATPGRVVGGTPRHYK